MRHGWRRLTAVVVVLLAGCGDGGHSPVAVISGERTWVDPSRETPATATFAGAPDRTLRVRLWMPARRRAAPLLVMAHGFGGLPERFDAFARAIAAAGTLVAAPAFPLTNAAAPGGAGAGLPDYRNQPADLSFVITQVLTASATAGNPLEGRVDPNAVAVLGHSLGGATVLGLTRKACCRDERVRASVLGAAIAGIAAGYGPDAPALPPLPTLVLHGTADTTVAYTIGRDLYARLPPPRIFVGLDGADHGEAVEDDSSPPIAARAAAQRAVIALLDDVFRGRGGELAAVLRELAAEGNVVEADPAP